jgi:hypothetical protein
MPHRQIARRTYAALCCLAVLATGGCGSSGRTEPQTPTAAARVETAKPGSRVDGAAFASRVTKATIAPKYVRMRTTMPGQGTVSVLDQVMSPQGDAVAPRARDAVYRKGETTYVGSARQAGTTVAHYRTKTVATRALALFLPTLTTDNTASKAQGEPITYDTWLDEQSRPVRIVVTVPDATRHEEPRVTRTTFERWGTPVKVERPPARLVEAGGGAAPS